MDREHKNRKYEDYITAVTRQAAAAGRREPYHLTYLKKYGERGRQKGVREIAESQEEQC